MRLSAVDLNEPKSQNTHLHVMEAYARLLTVWPDPGLRRSLGDLVEIMLSRIVDPATGHLGLFFARGLGAALRPGLLRARHRGRLAPLQRGRGARGPRARGEDPPARRQDRRRHPGRGRRCGRRRVQRGRPRGTHEHRQGMVAAGRGGRRVPERPPDLGGRSATCPPPSGPGTSSRRGSSTAPEGEWFRGVTRDGRLLDNQLKVSFWKCPYHNGRTGLEAVRRLREIAVAPKDPPPNT